MKNTFKNIIKAAAVATAVLMTASCSLEETKEGFVSTDDFFKTKAQCYAGLNSCYLPLNSIYNYTYMIATEGVTDIMHIKSGTKDAQLNISPVQPLFGETVWKKAYEGVRNCNATIDGIQNSLIAEDEKAPLLAEGKIMRAFYYYTLTCFFGDVPYYTEDVKDEKILEKVSKLPRMDADETRKKLIAELNECVPYCKQVRTSDVEDNRCGAAMGWMLIAKMAMWNKDWEEAISAIKKLEGIYGDLSQYPLSDIPFRMKNTPESIFEIQHAYVNGGISYTSNLAAICTPYGRPSGTSIYDGVDIPELGNQATTWTPLRPNGMFYNGLMRKDSKDLRKDMTIVWEYNGHRFNSTASTPWPGPKFWCPNMDGTWDHNNYKVFRYADALLMMAECCCELDDFETSIKYLNMIKNRAGISPYHFKTKERLTEEIRNERARELFGEFQRKYDLVRWGIWFEETFTNTDYGTVKDNILPCHRFYPIPDTQVVYSDHNLDNKEYDKYM